MGIGRPDGTLTRLCLRTISLPRQRMKISRSMRQIMLLLLLPFSFCSFTVLAALAPRRRDFCALWFLLNLDGRRHDALRAGLAPLSPSDRSLRLPTFLIAFELPISQALLIFFHDSVNSFLPLPSLHPSMPPLFPLILRLPALLGDLDCAS